MAKEKKTATLAALERTNPLSGLSIAAAKSIFDAARNGDTQRLHWIYQEIETQNAILSMAVTRRSGAAANFNWRVSERAFADQTLAKEQRDAADTFLAGIDNLSDLFEHLDLALFRGFAHAQPIWESPTNVSHIELIDSWKFLRKDGIWFYNPDCNGFSSSCVDCTNARLVTVERRRPVDVPALAIHLRHAVGSRDWGRFIERYALPKPAVVMAPNATTENKADYLESASALENGQVTVWPSGASLMDFAGSSRGVDPFSNFIRHQEETILRLATGGTLGSMAESGSGTLAGNAQADVWQAIVARDSGVIAQAVNRNMLRDFLAEMFPGQPVAVEFAFDLTQKPTPKEIFETATAARNAGYMIDQTQLEDETGYKLEKTDLGQGSGLPEAPSIPPSTVRNAQTSFKTASGAFKTPSSDSDDQRPPKTENALVEALEGLFEKALSDAAAETLKGESSADAAKGSAAPAASGAKKRFAGATSNGNPSTAKHSTTISL
jgi:phage gp29-like protein